VLGERAQAHRLGGVARADDPDRLGALSRAQHLPTRDHRAEDRFGERRPHAHKPPELPLLDHQHPPRARHTPGEKTALAGEQRQLADEVAGHEPRHRHLVHAVGAQDLNLAVEDDEKVIGGFARLEEQIPDSRCALAAKRGHFGELGRAEQWAGDGVRRIAGRAHQADSAMLRTCTL